MRGSGFNPNWRGVTFCLLLDFLHIVKHLIVIMALLPISSSLWRTLTVLFSPKMHTIISSEPMPSCFRHIGLSRNPPSYFIAWLIVCNVLGCCNQRPIAPAGQQIDNSICCICLRPVHSRVQTHRQTTWIGPLSLLTDFTNCITLYLHHGNS